ncbi:hypothetical protein EMIHUDRAFT_211963 [Emiliania huxleyi CCMP1516]|uniref:Cullin neddylation domain-containing protein n=2 Tax=Emiliania huxleyi TaxID=2903 RepID=A0A0D3IS00_EMIH1|nr:hypothetical protein EMIHUDRAFT_211963 [Emiliania huxleyi CCMP1516]EOD14035.1 hypothetical protein EMIHUDRAFT_211963 [Emiliania huxleyi CCMP1516]|eukprot:XP_005766464.1 hypothetical protein EMIHUDRAFT_211963 [Emiliania huxleyi CCMP1516]
MHDVSGAPGKRLVTNHFPAPPKSASLPRGGRAAHVWACSTGDARREREQQRLRGESWQNASATWDVWGRPEAREIEAAIVRIMKTRKTLDHQKLVLEASTQLMRHFKPDPRQIKKRIEDLIAREYLERDASNSTVYKYLA